jgi:sec-independent protein translocase protein TatC
MFFDNDRYPENYFDNTRMTFGDHLEELRRHLWRAIAGFGVAMIFCFFLGEPVLHSLIIKPVEDQLQALLDKRTEKARNEALANKKELRERLGENGKPRLVGRKIPRQAWNDLINNRDPRMPDNVAELGPDDYIIVPEYIDPLDEVERNAPVLQAIAPRASMKTFDVTEAMVVYMKVSMGCGFVVASPWIFWQIWMFIAAGLYPHEKKLVHLYLPFSLLLFLAGAVICQFAVLPKAIEALLWFNEWIGLEADLRLETWLSFAVMMPIVFGLSFQTPLLMMFAYKLGFVDIPKYKSMRKYAFFGLAVFAAIITPSVDALSMLFLWVPLCLLYELGIWLCVWQKRNAPALEMSDTDELIEV